MLVEVWLAESSGCIVNMASMLTYFGSGFVPGYSSSKGGVGQLTKSLAIAWASEGIRVNAVAPGWIRTEMTSALRQDAGRKSIDSGSDAVGTLGDDGRTWLEWSDFCVPPRLDLSPGSCCPSTEVTALREIGSYPLVVRSAIALLALLALPWSSGCRDSQSSLTESTSAAGYAVRAPAERAVAAISPTLMLKVPAGVFNSCHQTRPGVDFVCRLDPDHPLRHIYFSGYVCGGVAIGDVDNDGRADLFLVDGAEQKPPVSTGR